MSSLHRGSAAAGILLVGAAAFLTYEVVGQFGLDRVTLSLCGLLLLLAGLCGHRVRWQAAFLQILFTVAAALSVTLAADLIIWKGLLSGTSKLALVACAALCSILLGRSSPVKSREGHDDQAQNLTATPRLGQFLGVVFPIGFLVLVGQQFRIENEAFYSHLLPLTLYGFAVHYFLPPSRRLLFFLTISLLTFVGILGWTNAAWLVATGLFLIGLCHLPLTYRFKVALLLGIGVLLAFFRAEILPGPWPAAVWPILGSMFMFRLIIYLYDLKHETQGFQITGRLSYFFLLPNVVFPLFPIVDYKAFTRSYTSGNEYRVYQRGVKWLFWGITHLIAYRLVNHHFVVSPEYVRDISSLAQHLVFNFLLLLRVSGQFHLAIGMLILFGFDLPRTMRRLFIASSFTDFWRRANIYWKDFMLKVFYYPIVFSLRRLGERNRIMTATAFVFLVTWFLHGYQWFWLRGAWLFSLTDLLFWFLFGLLVLSNAVFELQRGRERKLSKKSASIGESARYIMSSFAVFATVAILYSLWTSHSLEEWIGLWLVITNPIESYAGLLLSAMVLTGLALAVLWEKTDLFGRLHKGLGHVSLKPAAVHACLILLLYSLGNPLVYSRMGERAESVVTNLRSSNLSAQDARALLRGYYEHLVGANLRNPDLVALYTKRPTEWPLLQDTEAARMTGDFRVSELVPSTRIHFHGSLFTTNRWGMRDQEYELKALENTYRVAVVGPSFVLGSGVADDEVFEAVLESRVNEALRGESDSRIEILNFGMAGYSALQELYILETSVLRFEPDALIFVGHQFEEEILVRNLASRIDNGMDLPYEYLVELAERARAEPGLGQGELERRLARYGPELLTWTYRRVVEVCAENQIKPIWVFIPGLELAPSPVLVKALAQEAQSAGFSTIDLSDVFEGHPLRSLIVAEWDRHPNALGHQLIADRLYTKLEVIWKDLPLDRREGL